MQIDLLERPNLGLPENINVFTISLKYVVLIGVEVGGDGVDGDYVTALQPSITPSSTDLLIPSHTGRCTVPDLYR